MSRPRKKTSWLNLTRRTPLGEWSRDTADLLKIIGTPEGEVVVFDPDPTPDELDALKKQQRFDNLKTLWIDPLHNHENISGMMIYILFPADGDTTRRDQCRKWLADVVEHHSVLEVEMLFKSIAILKGNRDTDPHRNYYFYWAYNCFIDEFGYEPSKQRLKKYVLKYPKDFKKMPDEGGFQEWTRMLLACGLSNLSD